MKLADLKLNPDNPRVIKDGKFKKLVESIKQDPDFTDKMMRLRGIVVNKENVILAGNMRYRALQELKMNEIPDAWVQDGSGFTPEQIKRFVVEDNLMFGEYDWDRLANEYNVEDLLKWGFDENELKIEKEIIEDEAPEVLENAISKYGEVYQLGRHRVMCGDATKQEDVELLMVNQKADMVFTDPPYGVDYTGKTKEALKIDNDKNTEAFAGALINYALVAKLGAAFYVCCPAGNNFKDFLLPFEEECKVSSTIIWVKNSMVLGHGDYHYRHEPILYGWLKNGVHKFYGDRTQTTVWEIDRPTQSREHPTMKPIALMTKAINNSSKQDDIVLDLFGGSGSTLIACEQTERTCYMMEIDPRYVDVIRKRYAKFIAKENEWEKETPKI